jgi:hypothetical protein
MSLLLRVWHHPREIICALDDRQSVLDIEASVRVTEGGGPSATFGAPHARFGLPCSAGQAAFRAVARATCEGPHMHRMTTRAASVQPNICSTMSTIVMTPTPVTQPSAG